MRGNSYVRPGSLLDQLGPAPSIIAVRPGGLGDLVLATPALRALRQQRPDLIHIQYAPVAFRWRRTAHLLPVLARVRVGRVPVVVTAHEIGGWPVRPPLLPERV